MQLLPRKAVQIHGKQLNYQKHYDALIESRKKYCSFSDYYEIHHIIPECLGGSNEPNNLVQLTAKEHYMAHWLLVKATKNDDLIKAFAGMCGKKTVRKFTSRQFDRARQAARLAQIGRRYSEESKLKMSISAKNKPPMTEEHKRKIGEKSKGRIYSEEVKKKHSEAQKNLMSNEEYRKNVADKNRGQTRSDETKKKISDAWEKRKLTPVSEETRKKMSESLKGRVFSEEHKRKLKELRERIRNEKRNNKS